MAEHGVAHAAREWKSQRRRRAVQYDRKRDQDAHSIYSSHGIIFGLLKYRLQILETVNPIRLWRSDAQQINKTKKTISKELDLESTFQFVNEFLTVKILSTGRVEIAQPRRLVFARHPNLKCVGSSPWGARSV